MLYLDWRFTFVALSIAPFLFIVVYSFTRRIKRAAREVKKKESEDCLCGPGGVDFRASL